MTNSSRSPSSAPGGRWSSLLLSLGVTALAAAVGAVASAGARNFYGALAKPAWAPSPLVFGPVWTVLYILMAVAAWLVWRRGGPAAAKVPLALYLFQLALNALWTWLFFRWRLGGWALLEIIVLWLVLLLTVVRFWRVRAAAGALLLPYWAWVTFATALTAAVWQRNPDIL
ncbi:MAG TPA: TspO/MBR family protein [Thermoanaerobaculia bacterium]|nr:TspO/MBR family protein [Thermoanaerobaculia bacterium]